MKNAGKVFDAFLLHIFLDPHTPFFERRVVIRVHCDLIQLGKIDPLSDKIFNEPAGPLVSKQSIDLLFDLGIIKPSLLSG